MLSAVVRVNSIKFLHADKGAKNPSAIREAMLGANDNPSSFEESSCER
jgi:hypothetical protein